MKNILKDIRTYFIALLVISVVWFIGQLILYPVLPTKYFILMTIVLLVIAGLLTLTQYKIKNKITRILGKVFIVLLSLILILVNFTYLKTVDLFGNIVSTEDTDVVSVIVRDDSTYQYIEDLKGKTYSTIDTRNQYVDQTLDNIKEENKEEDMNLKYYSGVEKLVNALYDENVDCIVINESYRAVIEDTYNTFTDDTRVIYSKSYTIQEEVIEEKKVDVTKDTFSLYVSGIDTYGSISTKSRSDVNMIVTVNPTTKNILLTSIPRDYYIPFQVLNGEKDKLTHSGLYGVNETKTNVGNYFGIEIPYYVRVNFTSLIDIVDAIGGIEVDNPRAFQDFKKGTIHLNGEQALRFSRDRYSFSAGDRERGRNQMRVITGIINKVVSPAIINNYMNLLDSLGSSFQTNLTEDEMLSLIRMQINDMSSWTITTQSVDGSGASLYSPIYGSKLYMMIPNGDSVNDAQMSILSLY